MPKSFSEFELELRRGESLATATSSSGASATASAVRHIGISFRNVDDALELFQRPARV
jgi:hypothetical protein